MFYKVVSLQEAMLNINYSHDYDIKYSYDK